MKSSTWKRVSLGEICKFKYGQMPKKTDLSETGYPVFSGYRIVGFASSYHYEHPEIIIVARGVGGTGDVKLSPPKCFLTNLSIAAQVASPHIQKRFLYFRLTCPSLWELRTGSAQAQITIERLQRHEVEIPSLSIQRKIAGVLSAYDDLIENHTRRIAILEAMTQAIYREWFAEFRFPGHEKIKLVDSTLGKIPNGWHVETVKSLVKRLKPNCHYTQNEVVSTGAIPVLDQSDAELLGYHDSAPDLDASHHSPLIIFGDHTCKMELVITPFSIGPNVVPFQSATDISAYYLYRLVSDLVETTEYKRHWSELISKEVVVCTTDLSRQFAAAIEPVVEAVDLHRKAIRNLRKTRDLLLPKLISGQLDVEDLDIDAGGTVTA